MTTKRRSGAVPRYGSEQRLAAIVVDWLKSLDWDVYQEVEFRTGGARCDIVARRGNVLFAVECKLTLSLAVLHQAWGWRALANRVAVAVPPTRNEFGFEVARQFGIGVLVVSSLRPSVTEHVPALLRRSRGDTLANALREQHRDYAPAGSGGGHYTAFQATCNAVREYVQEYPGASVRETMAAIKHHYMSAESARGAIAKWIKLGKIPGVILRRDGRTPRLYAESIEHPAQENDA